MLSYVTMPETFKEQFARGYQARRENRLADSRAIFLKAVRSASEEADRPALAEAGKIPDAISDFEKALRLRANFPQAENSLATALVALGR